MIDRDEAIRLIASYPGPVDKSVVRRLLMQMDEWTLPIKQKCTICPHCNNCDVNDDGTTATGWIPCEGCERRCERWENSKTSQD